MRPRNVSTWEAMHPLNGSACPITGRHVYIEDSWKVTRADYRLRTGILETGIALSFPVGHTKIDDTATFFGIMDALIRSDKIDRNNFVLVEDYTLHTGSDYEGRLTYIRRMIDEIRPKGIIFITRSTSWKLSIKIGTVFYGCPFPILASPSYREALDLASGILGRPLDMVKSGNVPDSIGSSAFSISMSVISPSLIHVKFKGRPTSNDISTVNDFYLSLPHRAELNSAFRTIHDFSELQSPATFILIKTLRTVLSDQFNNGGLVAIVNSKVSGFQALVNATRLFTKGTCRPVIYPDSSTAIAAMQPDAEFVPVFRDALQTTALKMLEMIDWNKPGYEELEAVSDPQLRPLALMLGSIKQDVDYYIRQRQEELDKLEEMNRRARQLSMDIEQALHRSEDDRLKAEKLSEDNFALSSEITSSQREVLMVLADYIDRRAHYPAGTTGKLARFASGISHLFGHREEDRNRLHDAILLMHTGYLAIPEDEEDCGLHCKLGGEILSGIYTFLMQYATDIARFHHEKWDGSGFPEKRSGEKIPHEARFITLCDYIMTCQNDLWEVSLAAESGKSLDPALVKIALENVGEIRAVLGELTSQRELLQP